MPRKRKPLYIRNRSFLFPEGWEQMQQAFYRMGGAIMIQKGFIKLDEKEVSACPSA